jgi:uncharacterized protein YcfJ
MRRSSARMALAFTAGMAASVVVAAPAANAQDLFIYAAQGQTQDQQDLDEVQCRRFATERTGFDPRETRRATTAPPEQRGRAVGGAARGALLGTAVGAIAGNTGRGAAIGAASGGLMGGMRRADSNRQRQDWARQESANYQQDRSQFNRAFAACLEGRGYTVR